MPLPKTSFASDKRQAWVGFAALEPFNETNVV
jgi:hypothetical protein